MSNSMSLTVSTHQVVLWDSGSEAYFICHLLMQQTRCANPLRDIPQWITEGCWCMDTQLPHPPESDMDGLFCTGPQLPQ